MKLKDLVLHEGDADQSELDDATYASIEKEVQTLAKDPTKEYSNALAVVHDAFEVCGVDRPTPAMRGAWSQYEKLISLSVSYLNKFRPKGNWRVTTSTSKVQL